MKYIFLDEFVWINIRKSILKERNASDLSKVIKVIEERSNSGEWIFPISTEHLIETSNTKDDTKRITTAFIMDEVSKGNTILHFSKLKDFEISKMLEGKYAHHYSAEVIQKDSLNLWGKSSQKLFNEICTENDIAIGSELYKKAEQLWLRNHHSFSVSMLNPQFIPNEEKEMYGKILDTLKQQDCTTPYVSEAQFLMYTLEQYYSVEQQQTILSHILKEAEKCEHPNAKFLQTLFYKLPTYYTNCVLLYKNMKMQNINQSANKNDFRDMLYLSYMIPYCDVVVTEKKWVSIAIQLHLDKIFETNIISDVNQLLHLP